MRKYVITVDKTDIEIVIPKMEIVNRRLLCVSRVMSEKYDPETKLWIKGLTTLEGKDGRIKDVPRFWVAKTAHDLEISPGTLSFLPLGTEVFPFIPPIQDFSFPMVMDYETSIKYIMFEWPEITAYLLPEPENVKMVK